MSTTPAQGAPTMLEATAARPPVGLMVAAFAAVYIIWGSTYLAIRLTLDSLPPFLLAGARFIFAGSILYGIGSLRGYPAPKLIHWRSAATVGILLLLVGNGGVVWAVQTVPTGVASVLVATVPLFMVILQPLVLGRAQRPSWAQVVGVLVGFGGVALLVDPFGDPRGRALELSGVIILLVASLAWAFGSLLSRKLPLPAPILGTGMEMLCGGVVLTVVGLSIGEVGDIHWQAIQPHSWWALAYLVSFGSLVGFSAYIWLLRVAPPPRVATYAYVNPIVAIALGSLVLHEDVTPRMWLAMAVIIGAVALIVALSGKRREQTLG